MNCCICSTSQWQVSHAKMKSALEYIVQHYRAASFLADVCIILLFFCLRFEVLELGFLRFTLHRIPLCLRLPNIFDFLGSTTALLNQFGFLESCNGKILSRFWPCPVATKHLLNFKQRNSEMSSPIIWTIGYVIHISSLWFVFPAAP